MLCIGNQENQALSVKLASNPEPSLFCYNSDLDGSEDFTSGIKSMFLIIYFYFSNLFLFN